MSNQLTAAMVSQLKREYIEALQRAGESRLRQAIIEATTLPGGAMPEVAFTHDELAAICPDSAALLFEWASDSHKNSWTVRLVKEPRGGYYYALQLTAPDLVANGQVPHSGGKDLDSRMSAELLKMIERLHVFAKP